jgi:hypothetical protein
MLVTVLVEHLLASFKPMNCVHYRAISREQLLERLYSIVRMISSFLDFDKGCIVELSA